MAETDHVFMKPLPNLASPTEAAAHVFGYMHASAHHQKVVDVSARGVAHLAAGAWPPRSPSVTAAAALLPPQLCWKGGSWSKLQPVGPSPLIITLSNLKKVAERWLEYSYILRADPMPKRLIQDWVLEMWGWSIAAASVGVRHKIVPSFQTEPNAYARTAADFDKQYYIFHYTYGIEYRLDGRPQGYNTIGEWSMDKRHYGGAYPPRNLEPPPEAANPSTKWLHKAWNDVRRHAGPATSPPRRRHVAATSPPRDRRETAK